MTIITLIPKINSPETPRDIRTIALLNYYLKFLTKLLANRLQDKMLQVVHKNQYGFIRIRTIRDCLAWSFEYLHECKYFGKRVITLKTDFSKAFDMMDLATILKMMKLNGFGDNS
jgi:hypothetical protein